MQEPDKVKPIQPGVREVLRNANFRRLWLAKSISEFGNVLTTLALVILVNRLTGSVAAIATLTITLLIPSIVFGMLAGVWVDRLDRRRIMIISDGLRGVLVLGFGLVGSTDWLPFLYALGLVQAGIGTFFNPAQNALFPTIVPKAQLLAANGLTQTSLTVAASLGGALAGVMIAALNLFWPIFVVDALTFLASALLIARLKLSAQEAAPKTSTASARRFWPEMGQGLSITLHNPMLLGTLVAAGVALLGLGAIETLFVPLLVNELHSSEAWLGPIQVAGTLATIVGGSLLAWWAGWLRPTTMICWGLIVLGLTVGLDGTVNAPWQFILLQVIIGLVITPINTSIVTINQNAVEDALRGRVGAARLTVTSVAQVLSMGFAGTLGDLIGVRNVCFVAGGFVIVAGLLAGRIFRTGLRPNSTKSGPAIQPH